MTGAWPGEDIAYRVTALVVPSQFGESVQRKANLKGLIHAQEDRQLDSSLQQRLDAAIDKAEAILAEARDPAIEVP